MQRRLFLAALSVLLTATACGPGAAPKAPGSGTSSGPPASSSTGPSTGAASASHKTASVSMAPVPLRALQFTSSENGWAGGAGILLHTVDGGASWSVAAKPKSAVTQIAFPDGQHGFALTENGLLGTGDGGATWNSRKEPSGHTTCLADPSAPCLDQVSFPSAQTGYGVAAVPASVGTNPEDMAVSPDGTHLYIANSSGTLSIYNLAKHALSGFVRLQNAPTGVAQAGSLVYVTNQNSSTLSAVDPTGQRVVKTAPTVANPCAVAASPDGTQLYVVGSQSMAIVSAKTLKAEATVPAGGGTCAVAVNPNGKAVYVVDQAAHSVDVVDPATGKISRSLTTVGTANALAVSPDGTMLYAASGIGPNLDAISTSSGKLLGSVKVGPLQWDIVTSPDGKRLYDLMGGKVALIDPASMKLLKTVPAPAEAFHIARTPDGSAIFVSGGANSIERINAKTLAATSLTAEGTPVRSDTGRPVPQAGTLFRTADGGQTWQPVKTPTAVQSACFTSAGTGYIAAANRVWSTTDGGGHWAPAFTADLGPAAGEGRPGAGLLANVTADVRCAGSRAWVLLVGSGAAMEHAPYIAFGMTAAGHWQPLIEENYTHMGGKGVDAPEGPGSYPGPYTINPDGTPVFGGGQPVFSASALQVGAKGAAQTIPGAQQLAALSFVSPKEGWALVGTGAAADDIVHTTDGGRHWTLQWPQGTQPPLRGISFVNGSTGYGLGLPGDENAVLKTQDGGVHWNKIASLGGPAKPYPAFPGLAFTSAADGFAADAQGTLMRTGDGGVHWSAVPGAPSGVSAVAFASVQDGCIRIQPKSGPAKMEATGDGGKTWADTPSGRSALGCALALSGKEWSAAVTKLHASRQTVSVVAYVPPKTAYAVGLEHLLRTVDQGQSWTSIPLPGTLEANGAQLDFIDASHGWMLTLGGVLWTTSDGGQHWHRIP